MVLRRTCVYEDAKDWRVPAEAAVAEVFERQLQDTGFVEEQEEEVDLGITLPVMDLPY